MSYIRAALLFISQIVTNEAFNLRSQEQTFQFDQIHKESNHGQQAVDTYMKNNPNRHAMDDCNKAVPFTREKIALGIEKGKFLARLYLEVRTKYKEAKDIAVQVLNLCLKKMEESKRLEDEYSAKLAKASGADNQKDPMTGVSNVIKWGDARDNEIAEISFYKMILDNAKEVEGLADKGLVKVKELRAEVEKLSLLAKSKAPGEDQKETDVAQYLTQLEALVDDANQVYDAAKNLWQQWEDSSKDYACGVPPAVPHAASQCEGGNTKYSPKCIITCASGYDGKGTKNQLRCNRQGKFGKQLYGEWTGMASCVGRSCGNPTKISKAKTVMQEIRYPHKASYVCYEGFSTDGKGGPKAFDVACGVGGSFVQNASHVCKAISCGSASKKKNTHPINGEFKYTEVAEYQCKEGFTVDGTPGGLKSFSATCQATGKFTEGAQCQPVRCGLAAQYDNTKLGGPAPEEEQFFGADLQYTCEDGYTINQKASGPDHFTLTCQADGEFGLKGTNGNAAVPTCRPVSAGIAPSVPHGNFNPREMFYGESVLVTANAGYSTTGNPTEGLSFTLTATAEGTYDGLEEFVPVVCGKPPSVEKAKTSFTGPKAVYGDLLNYDCEMGYSTDKTSSSASSSFSIVCETDSSLSKVPGLGKCANIDDCADHTCGPHGTCEDHLMNYTCACDSGYQQHWDNKTNELVCGNINDCGPEACGVGACVDGVNDYKCVCPTGYEQVDEENTEIPGKMDHACKAVTCGTPQEVANAATTPVEVGSEKAYYSNQIVYQCDMGYTLDGTATGKNHFQIECLASKSFTETKSCQPIQCNDAPVVDLATPRKTAATFNESIRYDCATGHTVDGTADGDRGFTITCQITGTFGEAQQCKPISCGEPDDVPNAFRPSGSLVFEQSVSYTCLDGFTEDGSKGGATKFSVECQDDGKLTKTEQCLPKVCGEPHVDLNVLFASTKDEGEISYPMSTEIICRDGYTVGGDPAGETTFLVKCLANGDFESFDERKCQPVMCGAPPSMKNATLTQIKTPTPAKAGLTRNVFYVSIGNALPDISKKAPHVTDVVANINQGTTSDLLPGLDHQENFVQRFSGALTLKRGGKYAFQLQSDDGSVLYINGKEIVNHDGLHGFTAKDGAVELEEGPQALTVDHFQKAGGAGIVLRWKGPDAGETWQVVPQSALQTKGGNLNYEEKAVYECLPGFTTGGEFDAPTRFNVECLPSGQLSAPAADMQCRNVNDCEQHTCGPKGQCIIWWGLHLPIHVSVIMAMKFRQTAKERNIAGTRMTASAKTVVLVFVRISSVTTLASARAVTTLAIWMVQRHAFQFCALPTPLHFLMASCCRHTVVRSAFRALCVTNVAQATLLMAPCLSRKGTSRRSVSLMVNSSA
jgi:hypothetical protein